MQIRIHPLLDQAFVPRWFLKYVLYHEMLHSVVPTNLCGTEGGVFTEEFNRRERQFRGYHRARVGKNKILPVSCVNSEAFGTEH